MIRAALMLYLIVGEVFVAMLLTYSATFIAGLRHRRLIDAIVGCAFVVATWPAVFIPRRA